jgi:hypothetical protein
MLVGVCIVCVLRVYVFEFYIRMNVYMCRK